MRARVIAVFLLLGLLLGCQGAPAAPASEPLVASALEALDDPSRAAVTASQIPVLLFADPWNERSIVTSGNGFYAISARDGELTVSLHATDVVHHPGDGSQAGERPHAVRGRPALVLVNEGIRSVTWEEGRTSYVVEVECYRPFEDPRCTEDAFVLELANGLVEVQR